MGGASTRLTNSEQYNGSAWTEVGDNNTARFDVGGSGTYTNALGFGGNTPPGYSAAKGGLVNLTRELALEWARFGIRVNALAPGYVATELTDEMIAGDSGRKWIERNTPLRRPAEVNELDGAMLLLASDAGSYITGETIAVDGGWLAR